MRPSDKANVPGGVRWDASLAPRIGAMVMDAHQTRSVKDDPSPPGSKWQLSPPGGTGNSTPGHDPPEYIRRARQRASSTLSAPVRRRGCDTGCRALDRKSPNFSLGAAEVAGSNPVYPTNMLKIPPDADAFRGIFWSGASSRRDGDLSSLAAAGSSRITSPWVSRSGADPDRNRFRGCRTARKPMVISPWLPARHAEPARPEARPGGARHQRNGMGSAAHCRPPAGSRCQDAPLYRTRCNTAHANGYSRRASLYCVNPAPCRGSTSFLSRSVPRTGPRR